MPSATNSDVDASLSAVSGADTSASKVAVGVISIDCVALSVPTERPGASVPRISRGTETRPMPSRR